MRLTFGLSHLVSFLYFPDERYLNPHGYAADVLLLQSPVHQRAPRLSVPFFRPSSSILLLGSERFSLCTILLTDGRYRLLLTAGASPRSISTSFLNPPQPQPFSRPQAALLLLCLRLLDNLSYRSRCLHNHRSLLAVQLRPHC